MTTKYIQKELARELALKTLYQLEFNDKESVLQFQWLEKNEYPDNVIKYTKKMVQGILEHWEEIVTFIKEQSEHWNWERISLVEKSILAIALYEMFFAENIPPTVAIDEAVELSKRFSDKQSYQFVNGILDAIKKKYFE